MVWVCIKSSLIHSERSTCFMMAVISFEAALTSTICTYTGVPAALTKLQLYGITCKTTNLHHQYIYVLLTNRATNQKEKYTKVRKCITFLKELDGSDKRSGLPEARLQSVDQNQSISNTARVQIVSTLKVLIMVIRYVVKIISRTLMNHEKTTIDGRKWKCSELHVGVHSFHMCFSQKAWFPHL